MTEVIDNDSETRSAYPPEVESLLPKARAVVALEGRIPAKRQLMRDLKIGYEKATQVHGRLITESPDVPVSAGAPEYDPSAEVNASEESERPMLPPLLKKPSAWPVILLALPAFVAVWSGWVGLGELTGFGVIHPLPGIVDRFSLNTAITLPIGFEAYAVYAIRVYLSPAVSARARAFAKRSTVAALVLGAFGQITYHLMAAQHVTAAPWQITTAVACLPVAVVFLGSALAHLVHNDQVKP